ncbi:MAG: hypothetical protein J3K34DRAFT_373965, partial [Monoraphidium minutum]
LQPPRLHHHQGRHPRSCTRAAAGGGEADKPASKDHQVGPRRRVRQLRPQGLAAGQRHQAPADAAIRARAEGRRRVDLARAVCARTRAAVRVGPARQVLALCSGLRQRLPQRAADARRRQVPLRALLQQAPRPVALQAVRLHRLRSPARGHQAQEQQAGAARRQGHLHGLRGGRRRLAAADRRRHHHQPRRDLRR